MELSQYSPARHVPLARQVREIPSQIVCWRDMGPSHPCTFGVSHGESSRPTEPADPLSELPSKLISGMSGGGASVGPETLASGYTSMTTTGVSGAE